MTQSPEARHLSIGRGLPVILTPNFTESERIVTIRPLRISKCSNFVDGYTTRKTYLLGHFSLSFGIKIERFVVLRAIGGFGPSMSPVTTADNN